MVEFAAGYGKVDIRRRLRVTLLESSSRILGAFPDAVSTSAVAQLRALGVDVRTGVRVVAADAQGFLLDGGERIPAALKVWAAGVRASTTLDRSGLELNRAGQVVVQQNLLARNDPSIFALGDCATFMPEGADRPLPPTAQVANQQALHLSTPSARMAATGQGAAVLPLPRPRRVGRAERLQRLRHAWPLRLFHGTLHQGSVRAAQSCPAYRRHQLALHGTARAALLWAAERINALVQPKIRLT